MMNKFQFALLLILVSFLIPGRMVAQSYTAGDLITLQVQDFSLIDTNHAPVSLTLSASVAGNPVQSVSNSNMYVKISSVVPGGTHRSITARIASGTVPAGTNLSLVAAPSTTANSGGSLGTVISTPMILSATDQILVNSIASCYTGTGYNDGYRLTYTWYPYLPATNYNLIKATTTPTTLTIVLTITAHTGN